MCQRGVPHCTPAWPAWRRTPVTEETTVAIDKKKSSEGAGSPAWQAGLGPAWPPRWAGRPPEGPGRDPAWAGHPASNGPGDHPNRPALGRPRPGQAGRPFFFLFQISVLKINRNRNRNNFRIRTPFSIFLDSLESPQRALQEYAEKHHSPTI